MSVHGGGGGGRSDVCSAHDSYALLPLVTTCQVLQPENGQRRAVQVHRTLLAALGSFLLLCAANAIMNVSERRTSFARHGAWQALLDDDSPFPL